MRVAEHRGLQLDIGLRPAAPADTDADPGGIEAQPIVLDRDHPLQAFGVRLGERIGNRRQIVEALRACLGYLALFEQHRQRQPTLAAP